MNILILVRDYKSGSTIGKNGMPEKSGAEIHVERHAKAFIRQGHRVTVMAKKRKHNVSAHEVIDDIELIRLISGFRSWMCIYYLLKNRKKIDAIYVFGQTSFNLTSIWLANYLGIATIYVSTMTGEAFENIKADRYFGTINPYRKYHDWILKKCSRFVAISQEIGDEFVMHGIARKKIHVLPQGVNLNEFYPLATSDKLKLRKKMQLPLDKKIVLFCSRLDYRKGIDILLDTWEKIEQECSDVYLVIVGGGNQEYVDQIEQMIKKGCHIKYVGEVSQPKNYFQATDIFVFPSRREGCPNVLMEAMACGCAPVVSKIGGCEDLVKDKINGLLFKKENSEEYIKKLLQLLRDTSQVTAFSKRSLQFCQENLDVDCVAKQLVALFAQAEKTDFE